MSKKIIILNGSPRAKGNTSALVSEFTRGAEEAGCEVVSFNLDKMNIHGCKGCFGSPLIVAAVRIIMEDWHGENFVDFHLLKKDESGWKIAAKVFTKTN